MKLPTLVVDMISRAGPALAVIVTTLVVAHWQLDQEGVRVVGSVPGGLPGLTLPQFEIELWQSLLVPAFLISLIGFVESVSVAQTLAARRRQRINPNHELAGLGVANIGSAISGGFPVTGGFARSVVNFDAGAVTPMAGIFTAVAIAVTTLFLTPWFTFLPNATLAATIVVAVLSLLDFDIIRRTWQYSKIDFTAMMLTIAGVFLVGVEAGVVLGVATSLLLFLWRTSSPHIAVVGQVPGTEHFRNIKRHQVITSPTVLSVRVDESLYFANARYLEDFVYDAALQKPDIRHVVLQCSAVNLIDASALESLESLSQRLQDAGVTLHLSEIKGPVMDALKKVDFVDHLSGRIFLSHYAALKELDPYTTLGSNSAQIGTSTPV
jgi:SulP family sulfate permease